MFVNALSGLGARTAQEASFIPPIFVNNGVMATSTTVLYPSGILNGDTLFLHMFSNTISETTPPSGWNFVNGNGSLRLYSKIANNEPASLIVSVTNNSSGRFRGIISAYRGVGEIRAPYVAVPVDFTNNVQINNNNARVCYFCTSTQDTPSPAILTINSTGLESVTMRYASSSAIGLGGGLYLGDGVAISAGTIPKATSPQSLSGVNTLTIILEPV